MVCHRIAAARTLSALFFLTFATAIAPAQNSALSTQPIPDATIRVAPLTTPLDSSKPTERFVAAHGRRGLVEGYASTGLEAWSFPFQIFKNYRPYFRHEGDKEIIDGATILSEIIYCPESVTRVYQGHDSAGQAFRAIEKLFVPFDEHGGIIQFTVESKSPVLIEARLTPVMGLMWPAELGSRTALWDQPTHSLTLFDAEHGYRALITSPQTTAHTWGSDSVESPLTNGELTLTLAPDTHGHASIAWSFAVPTSGSDKSAGRDALSALHGSAQRLIADATALESEAAGYYQGERKKMLAVETPDPVVNQTILWSEIALAQAWGCNDDLGCGFVAGYGPSRIERRPQYAWFFAGDGMVAADGALAAGDFESVRNELEFVLKYQDKKSGMIWHEISQSAPFLDWAGKYPYLYAHVDTTLQFLTFVDQYVRQSGDRDFLAKDWPQIQAAYNYAASLIDAATGLAKIPADKEGGNEQTRLIDDLGLSTSWVAAAASYAHLARQRGDSTSAKEAEEAEVASNRARQLIQSHYWSDKNNFWIGGHTLTGATFEEQHSDPSSALDLGLFTPNQKEKILDRIASPDFLTPWGLRSVAANSPGYSPESYAQGSVWPVNSAAWAQTYWADGRSETAWQLWRSLAALANFDSPGHLHEVFVGNAAIPQAQSVPEQSWSSSGFLTATIRGLLGITTEINTDGGGDQLTFAPHLALAHWPTLKLSNLRLGARQLTLQLDTTADALNLKIENPGSEFQLVFSPELPHGAQNITASVGNKPVTVSQHLLGDSRTATVSMQLPHGTTEIQIHFEP